MIKFHIFQPKNKYTKKKKKLELDLKRQPTKKINLRLNLSKMDQRGPKLIELTEEDQNCSN